MKLLNITINEGHYLCLNTTSESQVSVEFMLYLSPFNNCQTFSIASFYPLLHFYTTEEVIDILKEIRNERCSKNQLMVDIPIAYLSKLQSVFKPEAFLIQSEYINATNSSMVFCMLKMSDLN